MKIFLFTLFMSFFYSVSAQVLTMKIALPDSLKYEMLDSAYIDITCTNNITDTIKMLNPGDYLRSRIAMTLDGKLYVIPIKIDVYVSNVYLHRERRKESNSFYEEEHVITISPKNEKKVKYKFSIGRAVGRLERGNSYKLKLMYSGLLKIGINEVEEFSIESNEVEFKIY